MIEILKNSLGFISEPQENNSAQISDSDILKACEIMKNTGFDLLLSISAVDYIDEDKFELVYHFLSTEKKESFILKAKISRSNPKIHSVSHIYSAANWHERETFDMFGIKFLTHPDLRRILMPVDWVGYPLKKDYKLEDERLIWNER